MFRADSGMPPVVLLPGNHDPLLADSVWSPGHPFRSALPAYVHVVDRDDFELALGPEAVVLARRCRSRAGERDLAMALPERPPGDVRIRVGLVHGTSFDSPDWQTNFPVRRDAGVLRGLDYLAADGRRSAWSGWAGGGGARSCARAPPSCGRCWSCPTSTGRSCASACAWR
jgi:hypothetical protein